MRKHITLSLMLAGIFLSANAFADFTGKVVSLTDGDTLQVLNEENKPTKIRLDGIDAPEKNQPFGTAARKFLAEKCFGSVVTVQEKGTDKYGRTIGVIILEDGRNLNGDLVSKGFAWWYREYAPDNKDLERAELAARTAKVGLWSEPFPTAPWEWRDGKRKGSDVPSPSATSPILSAPSEKMEKDTQFQHWFTSSTRKRHNSSCRYYKTSKGRECGPSEGIPCKVCGG